MGVSQDDFNLDSNWEIIPYSETDYNVVYDEIKYDYLNDLIIYRKDTNNNEVETSKADLDFFINEWGENINPIQLFQWGREYIFDEDEWIILGVGNNKVINRSFIKQLNSYGSIQNNTINNASIENNTLENYGYIQNNTLENNGSIQNNTINYGYIENNTLNYGYIQNNTLENNASIQNNTLNYGYIYNNTINYGYIENNTLENNASIQNNTINNASIENNTINNASIYNNTINNASIYNNTLENNASIENNTLENYGYIQNNTLENNGYIRLGLSNAISTKTIQYLTINGGDIGGAGGIDLSTATLVYATYTREVFKNSAGVTKIKYFNENDVLVVADYTD